MFSSVTVGFVHSTRQFKTSEYYPLAKFVSGTVLLLGAFFWLRTIKTPTMKSPDLWLIATQTVLCVIGILAGISLTIPTIENLE